MLSWGLFPMITYLMAKLSEREGEIGYLREALDVYEPGPVASE